MKPAPTIAALFLVLLAVQLVALSQVALAQDAPAEPKVAVMVGDMPVFASEVQQNIQAAFQGKQVTQQQLAALQIQALNQLVQQRLVVLGLEAQGRGASETEIDAAIAQLEEQLAARDQNLDEFLQERQITRDALRADVAFKIGSSKYLSEELTDEALEAYFEANRPRFDGSLINVGHIILQADGPNKAAALKKALIDAAAIRQRIESGEITFEEAAREYSAGPSRQSGGQLGFIPRRGIMDEQFSEAAFNLQQGEISQPVVTKFGVHLIRWVGAEPGDKAWMDVKGELQKALGNKALNDLAEEQRKTTTITAVQP